MFAQVVDLRDQHDRGAIADAAEKQPADTLSALQVLIDAHPVQRHGSGNQAQHAHDPGDRLPVG